MRADAVFEGGGVRGIALVGALAAAEEAGYTNWVNVAGASVGAVLAALRQVGFGGPGLGLLLAGGLYSLLPLEHWLTKALSRKGFDTFGDRVLPDAEARYRHRLQVITSDLAREAMVVLPRDAGVYGIEPDAMPVARAVLMSACIPLYFRPVRWRGGVFVDGGLLSNFPVWLFDAPGAPRWPTFGFHFQDAPTAQPPRPPRWPWDIALASIGAMLGNQNARQVPGSDVARVIEVPTLGISPTDFNLSRAQRTALYRAGYESGARFFASWDFGAHVAARMAAASRPPIAS
jgi:NTE family protein